jgi:hypothetical protein
VCLLSSLRTSRIHTFNAIHVAALAAAPEAVHFLRAFASCKVTVVTLECAVIGGNPALIREMSDAVAGLTYNRLHLAILAVQFHNLDVARWLIGDLCDFVRQVLNAAILFRWAGGLLMLTELGVDIALITAEPSLLAFRSISVAAELLPTKSAALGAWITMALGDPEMLPLILDLAPVGLPDCFLEVASKCVGNQAAAPAFLKERLEQLGLKGTWREGWAWK